MTAEIGHVWKLLSQTVHNALADNHELNIPCVSPMTTEQVLRHDLKIVRHMSMSRRPYIFVRLPPEYDATFTTTEWRSMPGTEPDSYGYNALKLEIVCSHVEQRRKSSRTS